MAWGVVIAAAGTLLSSYSASRSSKANARLQEQYAAYNSAAALAAGQANAQATMAMGSFNASMNMMMAEFNSGQIMEIASYNAGLALLTSEYNGALLEDEARLIWETAELDMDQMGLEFAQVEGRMRTGYGASGVTMDQDTPLTAITDAETQHEMNVMIVRHGADIQASKMRDAAARSRWEGKVEAQKIMYEGKMASLGGVMNAAAGSYGVSAQAAIDSSMMNYNAMIDAGRIQFGGQVSSQEYTNQANSQMASGLFSATGTVATGYVNSSTAAQTTSYTGYGGGATSTGYGGATSTGSGVWDSSRYQLIGND